MVGETHSGSEAQTKIAQLDASQGILGACDNSKTIISVVQNSAPFDKKARDTWDWMIRDEIESRIGRLSAVGLCLRWQVKHNSADALEALNTVEKLSNSYLVREEPEKSPELTGCMKAALSIKPNN